MLFTNLNVTEKQLKRKTKIELIEMLKKGNGIVHKIIIDYDTKISTQHGTIMANNAKITYLEDTIDRLERDFSDLAKRNTKHSDSSFLLTCKLKEANSKLDIIKRVSTL